LNRLKHFQPKTTTVVAQIKVPGIQGSMLIFWDADDKTDSANDLGKRGYWYFYQKQVPPAYIGIKKSDVIKFIKSWLLDPGVLLHVPNVQRFRGRFICEYFEMQGITDCLLSIGTMGDDEDFSYEVVSSKTYFKGE